MIIQTVYICYLCYLRAEMLVNMVCFWVAVPHITATMTATPSARKVMLYVKIKTYEN